MKDVFIVSATRTPLGSFGGALSSLSAVELGACAIKGAIAKIQLPVEAVDEVLMGNVLSANLGQAPARQAALKAGLLQATPCTTINKVCASGMKSVMLAAQSIMLGQADVIVAGGMESMSNAPYYLPKARSGYNYGHGQLVDGLMFDGLTDAYDNHAMGICADDTATDEVISRAEQDRYAIQSYKRAQSAWEKGVFDNEITPVEVPQRKGEPIVVKEDEEYKKVKFEKIPSLRPVFSKNGTVTAANASTINDGASAIILASEDAIKKFNLNPIAKIISFADAAKEPQRFTTAPVLAAQKALDLAGLTKDDVSYFEVNEAFSVVALAFMKTMSISEAQTNVFGGAVSIGHPLGVSGNRIITTLNTVLKEKKGAIGLAAICNGGGGASAMIIERV